MQSRCFALSSTARQGLRGVGDSASLRCALFVHWYNLEHKHGGIRYVSPQQRHTGEDQVILAARHASHTDAKARNPSR